jgi:arsenite/tail-anchored protein-transporting ATPase
VPILRAPLFDEEVVGMDALDRLAEAVYADRTADAVYRQTEPLRFDRTDEGYTMSLTLPFVDKGEVDVFRAGDELHVKVGSHHRSILLPAALTRCDIAGAGMADGQLAVRFAAPDRGQDVGA